MACYILDASEVFPSNCVCFFSKSFLEATRNCGWPVSKILFSNRHYLYICFLSRFPEKYQAQQLKQICVCRILYAHSSWNLQMRSLVLCKSVGQKMAEICNYLQFEMLFNEWISTIFRISMDSEPPSSWWQRLLNKFVAFNNLLLGGWQPSLSQSPETRFAGMPL